MTDREQEAVQAAEEALVQGELNAELGVPVTWPEVRHLHEVIRALLAAHRPTEPDEDDWEYAAGYEGREEFAGRWFALGDCWFSIREAAEGEVSRYLDPQVKLIRRRKPGTPEPVTPRGEDR